MKIKKNLASSIKKIEILPKSIDANRKLGLFIEYEEGDICLTDSTKKYKSYLYLKCNKYEISSPKLIKTKDNNCTYIFEWPSPNACKNCLTKEIKYVFVGFERRLSFSYWNFMLHFFLEINLAYF